MKQKHERLALHALILTALASLVGRVDFFPDWIYARGIQLTSYDRPFDLVFTTEKIVLFPLILFAVHRLYGLAVKRKNIAQTARDTLLATFLGTVILVGPAILAKHVKFEPKLPDMLTIWSFHNLIFVCVIEELLFRNYVFEAICKTFHRHKHAMLYAIAISSVIFGLYHFRSGPILVTLAAIAGATYTLAYIRGGLIAAILAHFGVNLVHFLLFSYPALRS